jgi:hypothetical protein
VDAVGSRHSERGKKSSSATLFFLQKRKMSRREDPGHKGENTRTNENTSAYGAFAFPSSGVFAPGN